ncbi:MAG: choice-of-anchor Q domain-containing protein [Bacteroidales bacterium]
MIPKSVSPLFIIFVMLFCGSICISCEKDPRLEDLPAKLVFSADTVLFDTIFTGIGSATRHFKVYNPYKETIEIGVISLSGLNTSAYRINVDGVSGRVFNNIILRGGDSLYIFVEATIDPLDGNLPMVVEDSILFSLNGNPQSVKLVAWGQDFKILDDEALQAGILTAEKPYLVYNSITVDSGRVLHIEPGARLHFHRNSGLYVAGSVIVSGSYDQPVIFEGSRTETSYRNIPGQWEGIILMPESRNNRFLNSRIRNAVNGILVNTEGEYDVPVLYLANSRIENMTFAGLFTRNTSVYSYNTIISNCGHHAVAISGGGNYSFYHCTIVNYRNFSARRTPSVIINNDAPVNVVVANTIIHGSHIRETGFPANSNPGFDVEFSYCLLPLDENDTREIFQNCIFDTVPGFLDSDNLNYRLAELSSAIDAGDPAIGRLFPTDYEGKSRLLDKAPDIGAFERYIE